MVQGGNRNTLESSGHVVEDNEIWRFSREGAAGYHAVGVSGVGTLVRYNHMHEGQYTAVKYQVKFSGISFAEYVCFFIDPPISVC